MTKQEFLDNQDVKKLIQYLVSQSGKISNKIENYEWGFNVNYKDVDYKGKTYAESETVLNIIQKDLKDGIKNHDSLILLEASKAILKWGGVLGTEKKGNLNRLIGYKEDELANLYKSVASKWNKLENNEMSLVEYSQFDFPSNAGFTKIYSLLFDGFIIYDSRVGAALAKFILETFKNNVPSELRIDLPMGRENKNNPGRRNPNALIFKPFSRDFKKHFISNVKSSWILQEVAKETNPELRKIEAALFMLGYDVNK